MWVAPDDYLAQQNELRALKAYKHEQDRKFEEAEQARIRALAEKGQIEEAFSQQQQRYEKKYAELSEDSKQLVSSWLEERQNMTVAEALAGRQFAGVDPNATAAQLRLLLGLEIEAVRVDGKPVIRDRKTLRPAAEYLKERLDSPELAIYFQATTRGGAGTDGTRPAASTPKTPEDAKAAWLAKFLADREDAQQARW